MIDQTKTTLRIWRDENGKESSNIDELGRYLTAVNPPSVTSPLGGGMVVTLAPVKAPYVPTMDLAKALPKGFAWCFDCGAAVKGCAHDGWEAT